MSEVKQVSAYDQMLKDAYEWWEYLISKTENDRLIKKYYPNEKTGYPRFFMDTDKLRIYCLENKIEPPAAQPTGEQREVYEPIPVEKEPPDMSTYYNCIVVPTRFNLNNTANVFFNADTKTWSISPNDRFIKVSHWLKRTIIGSNEAELEQWEWLDEVTDTNVGNIQKNEQEADKDREIELDYIQHQNGERYIRDDYVIRNLYPAFLAMLLKDGRIKITEGNKEYFSTLLGTPITLFDEFIPENQPTAVDVEKLDTNVFTTKNKGFNTDKFEI